MSILSGVVRRIHCTYAEGCDIVAVRCTSLARSVKSFYFERGWLLLTYLVVMVVVGVIIEIMRYSWRLGLWVADGTSPLVSGSTHHAVSTFLVATAFEYVAVILMATALRSLTYTIVRGLGASQKDSAAFALRVHRRFRGRVALIPWLVAVAATVATTAFLTIS